MGIRIYNSGGVLRGVRLSKNLPEENDDYTPEPQEPDYELPTWNNSSDLGTYEYDEEVAITLSIYDVSNVLDDYSIVGELPSGVVFNNVGGTISGFIEDNTSKEYNITISINTTYGDIISKSFTISSLITQSSITWDTDSNLGTYDPGQTVNQNIGARIEQVSV